MFIFRIYSAFYFQSVNSFSFLFLDQSFIQQIYSFSISKTSLSKREENKTQDSRIGKEINRIFPPKIQIEKKKRRHHWLHVLWRTQSNFQSFPRPHRWPSVSVFSPSLQPWTTTSIVVQSYCPGKTLTKPFDDRLSTNAAINQPKVRNGQRARSAILVSVIDTWLEFSHEHKREGN